MTDEDFKTMIIEHMQNGFLENIIDMFKHDESLYPLIIDMIRDERMRVRLGAVALVEELTKYRRELLIKLVPDIAELLKSENPMIRGDGAYLLGLINHKDVLPYLLKAENDEDISVREIVRDAINEINGSFK